MEGLNDSFPNRLLRSILVRSVHTFFRQLNGFLESSARGKKPAQICACAPQPRLIRFVLESFYSALCKLNRTLYTPQDVQDNRSPKEQATLSLAIESCFVALRFRIRCIHEVSQCQLI